MSELVQSAREGDLEPFKKLFSEPDATTVFENSKDEYNGSTALHMVAANGHEELLAYILEHLEPSARKRIVNMPNESGNTALHWACLTGVLPTVKLLVGAEADALLQNKGGKDSIYQAEESGNQEIVDYLLGQVDMNVEETEEEVPQEDDEDEAQ